MRYLFKHAIYRWTVWSIGIYRTTNFNLQKIPKKIYVHTEQRFACPVSTSSNKEVTFGCLINVGVAYKPYKTPRLIIFWRIFWTPFTVLFCKWKHFINTVTFHQTMQNEKPCLHVHKKTTTKLFRRSNSSLGKWKSIIFHICILPIIFYKLALPK